MSPETVPLFRAPMRSRDPGVPEGAGPRRAIERGVCGIGGRLRAATASIEEAVAAAGDAYDDRLARRLRRFAEAPEGAYVWTRDDGGYILGRLTGPWAYDESAGAAAADLVHVRPCAWRPAPEVPAAVVATFTRGGRNWQRIRSLEAYEATARLWEHTG